MTGFSAATIREDFPILAREQPAPPHGRLVYLDNAATTQCPRPVLAAMLDFWERDYANVHRGSCWLAERSTERYENARDTLRRFLNAESCEEVIFTSGTTAAINLVTRAWGDDNVRAGDEILVTELEHHSNIVPWQQLDARTGCRVRFLPIDDEGRLEMERLDEFLGPRTRLVALAAVSNVLGTASPLGPIIQAAHAAGAKVLVDAAQAAARQPLDVRALGADFLALSGHKMLGPCGVGVLYGRRDLLEAMRPFAGGGGMAADVDRDGFLPADLPMKLEAGTPPIVQAVGMAAAVEYLQAIGLPAIARHERRLTALALKRLAAMAFVRVVGPKTPERSGIVSFTVDGVEAETVAACLDATGIMVRAGVHCAMPLHRRLGLPATVRASFALYNTEEDVDALAEALNHKGTKAQRPSRRR